VIGTVRSVDVVLPGSAGHDPPDLLPGVAGRSDDVDLAHTLAYHVPGESPRLEYRPVRVTNWEPKARTY